MPLSEEDRQFLLKQIGWRGSATDIIELLGLQLKDSNTTTHRPAFQDPVAQELYNRISTEVAEQGTVLNSNEKLRQRVEEEPAFLEEFLDNTLLPNFGSEIWGREDRDHLIETAVGNGLYIDEPAHRERIRHYLRCWIVRRIHCYIQNKRLEKKRRSCQSTTATQDCETEDDWEVEDMHSHSFPYTPEANVRRVVTSHSGRTAIRTQNQVFTRTKPGLSAKGSPNSGSHSKAVAVSASSGKENQVKPASDKRKEPSDDASTRPSKVVKLRVGSAASNSTLLAPTADVNHSNISTVQDHTIPPPKKGCLNNPISVVTPPSTSMPTKKLPPAGTPGLLEPPANITTPVPQATKRANPLPSPQRINNTAAQTAQPIGRPGTLEPIPAQTCTGPGKNTSEIAEVIYVKSAPKNSPGQAPEVPPCSPSPLTSGPDRDEVFGLLIDLLSGCSSSQANSKLDLHLTLLFENDTPRLEKSMGADFPRRKVAFLRWMEMRTQFFSQFQDFPYVGDPSGHSAWEWMIERLKGMPFPERAQGFRKLTKLKAWAKEKKREQQWIDEETFDADVAAVLEELCDNEVLKEAGGLKEEVEKYNKNILIWFIGKRRGTEEGV